MADEIGCAWNMDGAPTEEYSDSFVHHAAVTSSQYDITSRTLAADLLRARSTISTLTARAERAEAERDALREQLKCPRCADAAMVEDDLQDQIAALTKRAADAESALAEVVERCARKCEATDCAGVSGAWDAAISAVANRIRSLSPAAALAEVARLRKAAEAAVVLAKFAKTAPGRLPEYVTNAIEAAISEEG